MALFSQKNDTPTKEGEKESSEKKDMVKAPVVKKALPTDRNISSVIIKPRVTEKAVGQNGNNVYTFVVRRDATKFDVRDAIIGLFDVTPVKVNIVNKAPRQSMSRSKGRKVTEKGMKKAYVYLKDGDSINLV